VISSGRFLHAHFFLNERTEVTDKTVEPAKERATVKRRGRLSERDWAEATALWEQGVVTYAQLAEKFDRHEQSFVQYFRRRGIKKGSGRAKTMAKVESAVEKQLINDAAIIAARIKETKEEHYKMASGLAKLTWSEVLKTKQDGAPIATALNNLKALDSAMSVLKKAREERYAVLGLDRPDAIDENDVPELVISELTADQIETLRARSFRELNDLGGAPMEDIDDEDDGVVEET
jgi:hypothetical protein